MTGDWLTTIFGASSSWSIDAGGCHSHLNRTGHTVTADTGDVVTLTNTDGSNQAQVDVLIAGTSA